MTSRGVADDRGSVSVLIAVMALSVASLLVLVVDVGARITAATKADTFSAEAARAAVIAIGRHPNSPADAASAARSAASSYLSAAGVTSSTVTVTGSLVRVRVSVTDTGPISGTRFTQSSTHEAQLKIGVESGEVP